MLGRSYGPIENGGEQVYSKPKRFLAPTAFEAVPARLSGLLSMKLMRGTWRLNPRRPYSSWLVLALCAIGKYFSGSSVAAVPRKTVFSRRSL